MSKTMDNDTDPRDAEFERLKGDYGTRGQLIELQDKQIEELTTQNEYYRRFWSEQCDIRENRTKKVEAENTTLRARVEELVVLYRNVDEELGWVSVERDNLRARVEELEQFKNIANACEVDYRHHIKLLREERDELRAELHIVNCELDNVKAERDELALEVGELRLDMDKAKRRESELREKLAASEAQVKGLHYDLRAAVESDIAAREQLAETQAEVAGLNEENLYLDEQREKQADYMRMQEKRLRITEKELSDMKASYTFKLPEGLKVLQPPAPTIVKQTWRAVYENGAIGFACHEQYKTAVAKTTNYLRLDHMSDGSVVATLESIGESK